MKTKAAKPGSKGLEMGLKTEKTVLHDKYDSVSSSRGIYQTPVAADRKSGSDSRRESGAGSVSLPELRKNSDG